MTCIMCGSAIQNIRASYGDVDAPICWECWCEMEDRSKDDWYGLAPHTHNLQKTGSYIGSTEFVKCPEPNAAGWIDCSFMGPSWVGTWFKPDEEDPGVGVYSSDVMRVGAAA